MGIESTFSLSGVENSASVRLRRMARRTRARGLLLREEEVRDRVKGGAAGTAARGAVVGAGAGSDAASAGRGCRLVGSEGGWRVRERSVMD